MTTKFRMLAVVALAGGIVAPLTSAFANVAESTPVDPTIFPSPKPGYKQHFLQPPPQSDESLHLIEIVVGQTMLTDCNSVRISGDIDKEDLDGWGYPYFEIDDIGPPAQTMMACPQSEKTETFVPVYFGDDALVRYNSKLPLVIYAPQDLTVGYRVWSTDAKLHLE